jgi:hypothetical protein
MGTKISALSTATAAETQSGFVPIITGTSGSFTTKRAAVSNIGGGGGSVTISSTAPTATNGALWFNEDAGELYIYSSDLNGWIQTNGGGGSGGGEVYDSRWIVCSPSTSGIGKYMDFTHSLGEQPQNITVLLSGSASGADAWEAHDIILDGNSNNVYGYQAAEIGNSTMRIWMSQYGVQEHKGAAWSADSSANGATKHQWGSGNASYVRVIATVGTGGGSGSSAALQVSVHRDDYDKTPRAGANIPGLVYYTDSLTWTANSTNGERAIGNGIIVTAPTAEAEWLVSAIEGMNANGPNQFAVKKTDALYQPYGYTDNYIGTGTMGAITGYDNSYNYGGYVLTRGENFKLLQPAPNSSGYAAQITAKWRGTSTVVDQSVFSGASPFAGAGNTGWSSSFSVSTLDLSQYVGEQPALVRLIVTPKTSYDLLSGQSGEPVHAVIFRRKGDTIHPYDAGDNYTKGGISAGYVKSDHSEAGYQNGFEALVPTDAQGRIEMYHVYSSAQHNIVLDSWMPMSSVNQSLYNGNATSGYTTAGTNQQIRGGSLGGSATGSVSNATGGAYLRRIDCGVANQLVILRVTGSATGETFFRCPYDPIQMYYAVNYAGHGMTGVTRSTGDAGGYVAVVTDGDGYVDAQSSSATNLNVYHVGTAYGSIY